jgi:hypothetical protein
MSRRLIVLTFPFMGLSGLRDERKGPVRGGRGRLDHDREVALHLDSGGGEGDDDPNPRSGAWKARLSKTRQNHALRVAATGSWRPVYVMAE